MGNCLNDTPVKRKTGNQSNNSNPINLIMGTWNIDNIKNKWQQNQLEIISAKLNTNEKTISYTQFVSLFPKLKVFAEKTNKNIYRLFNVSDTSKLTKQELLNALTLIEKNENSQVMSNMIFYVYSTAPDKKTLNQSDIAQFVKQNKRFRIQQTSESSEHYPLYMNNRQFFKLFDKYDLNKYKKLFQWDLTDQQKKFALALGSNGIRRKIDQKVFIVQYQWFLYWKVFMQTKYGISINISDSEQNDKKNNKFLARRYSSTNMNIQDIQKDKKIPPIKNYVLQGDHENCLVDNLHQFHDYILVPEWIWKQFSILYGGDPIFQRKFPNIYLYQITVVQTDQNGKFLPLKSTSYANKQKNSTIKEFKSKKVSQDSLCFYKYPGKQDWTLIQNIELSLQALNLHHKTFIVFIPKQFRETFETNYNVQVKSKMRTIKKNIKNYGSLLNAEIDGVLKKGYVVQFSNSTVTLQIKDQKGNFNLTRFSLDSLKQCNSNQLTNSVQNGLAGLQNIGNTCFMNAVIQCLIRTPFFGDYLQKQDYKKQNEKLILEELYKIYKQSKKSRQSIQMNKFKRAFDNHFPFFQGYAQHDAQQFLICLLSRISQELKQKRISFGQSIAEQSDRKQQHVNKKVIKFFSGTMETSSKCVQCKNFSVRVEPFFTYSLSLPNIMESQFEYIHISKQLSLKKMCLTLQKDIIVQDFVKEVSKQLKIPLENLLFYSIFNNEWMSNIQQECPQRQIEYFKNYDIKIGCYQILSKQNVQQNDFRYSDFSKKSVKIQMRNRIYEQKTKNYRSFYAPLMMEINQQTTGKSLKESINQKLNKFIDANYHDNNQNIRLSSSSIKKTKPNQDFVHKSSIFTSGKQEEQNRLLQMTPNGDQIKDKNKFHPYTIRFMKNYNNNDSYCWFCRDQLSNSKVDIKSDKYCNGCNFLQSKTLFQQQNFKVYGDSLVIVIDWNDALAIKNFKIQNDYSCHEASLRQKNRKTKIEKLLRQNSDMVQKVQLKCQKEGCHGNEVQRVQRIKNTPNILLIHLKRFKYEDNHFMKLNNPVVYPENLILPGSNDQYELYGSLIHTGSGMGGHYYSFVKVSNQWFRCDDEKVYQDKQGQHIDQKAYILFYKKVNFQPSLVCLRF